MVIRPNRKLYSWAMVLEEKCAMSKVSAAVIHIPAIENKINISLIQHLTVKLSQASFEMYPQGEFENFKKIIKIMLILLSPCPKWAAGGLYPIISNDVGVSLPDLTKQAHLSLSLDPLVLNLLQWRVPWIWKLKFSYSRLSYVHVQYWSRFSFKIPINYIQNYLLNLRNYFSGRLECFTMMVILVKQWISHCSQTFKVSP